MKTLLAILFAAAVIHVQAQTNPVVTLKVEVGNLWGANWFMDYEPDNNLNIAGQFGLNSRRIRLHLYGIDGGYMPDSTNTMVIQSTNYYRTEYSDDAVTWHTIGGFPYRETTTNQVGMFFDWPIHFETRYYRVTLKP